MLGDNYLFGINKFTLKNKTKIHFHPIKHIYCYPISGKLSFLLTWLFISAAPPSIFTNNFHPACH